MNKPTLMAQLVELQEENARLREDAERYHKVCRMLLLAGEIESIESFSAVLDEQKEQK